MTANESSNMNSVVIFEWKFTPPDYFEEPIEVSEHGYTMTIADGKAQAKLDSEVYEADPSIRQRMHNDLKDRCLAGQLVTHRAYELSNSTMTRVHPDGREDFFLDLEPGIYSFTGHAPDIRVTDRDGNIVSDTKRDRIEKKKTLAELVTKHHSRDALLASLIRSHDAAVRDAKNELVHLEEIREALVKRFGDEVAAQKALGISKTHWKRMGKICNDPDLRQGRHRGKAVGELRDATQSELAEVRRLALSMIESYLRYLEVSGK